MAGGGIEAVRVGRGANMHLLPFDALKVDPGYNGRPLNREHVESLKAKIRSEGYDESKPIRVRNIDGEYFIRDGLHRFTAMSELAEENPDIKGIAVVVAPKGTNEADDVFNMINSNDGLRFSMLEIAALIKRLMTWGKTKEEIATRIGKKVAYINDCLSLGEAAPEVHQAVEDGTIAVTTAAKAARLPVARQREIVTKARETKKRITGAEITRERSRSGMTATISTVKVQALLLAEREKGKTEFQKGVIEGIKAVLKIAKGEE
jgi:ParB-like chromosome segregation protein Spo0J